MPRRRFGSIRRLSSGKFHASFVDPDGQRKKAPESFRNESDAARYLDRVEREIQRGHWIPDAGLGATNATRV